MLAMPKTLTALVQYANERSGIDPVFTQNALEAIDAGRDDYVRLITEGPGGGFSGLVGDPDFALTPEELDDLPPELRALFGHNDEYAEILASAVEARRRQLSELVGGPENLESLSDDPLPLEDFDPAGIDEDVVERLQPLLPQIRTVAEEFFNDPEYATIVYRILAEVARRDPAVFRRRFIDANMLSALFWVAGCNNDAFDRSRRNGVEMTIKNLQHHLGVKTPPSQRGTTLLQTLGRADTSWGVVLGDPGLITSERRAQLLEIRDWAGPEH